MEEDVLNLVERSSQLFEFLQGLQIVLFLRSTVKIKASYKELCRFLSILTIISLVSFSFFCQYQSGTVATDWLF